VRMPVIETGSPEWRSSAWPSSYTRVLVGNPRIELGGRRGGAFTEPLSHQTWRCPKNRKQGSESNRLCPSASGYEPDQRPVLVPASWRKVKESNHRDLRLGSVFKTDCPPLGATFQLVVPARFERAAAAFGERCSGPLSYGT
jgi:hypothetical protein